MNIPVSRIGLRLRKERERLQLSQYTFGQIGGVEVNAQGKYESGCRLPKADYLVAVAAAGVDILFVLTGTATPIPLNNLSVTEESVLFNFRSLHPRDQDTIGQLTISMAELQSSYLANVKLNDTITQKHSAQRRPEYEHEWLANK